MHNILSKCILILHYSIYYDFRQSFTFVWSYYKLHIYQSAFVMFYVFNITFKCCNKGILNITPFLKNHFS